MTTTIVLPAPWDAYHLTVINHDARDMVRLVMQPDLIQRVSWVDSVLYDRVPEASGQAARAMAESIRAEVIARLNVEPVIRDRIAHEIRTLRRAIGETCDYGTYTRIANVIEARLEELLA